jgi:hypothetical protein
MFSLEQIRRALGGNIVPGRGGPQVVCAGPGHSPQDRSLAVMPSLTAPKTGSSSTPMPTTIGASAVTTFSASLELSVDQISVRAGDCMKESGAKSGSRRRIRIPRLGSGGPSLFSRRACVRAERSSRNT